MPRAKSVAACALGIAVAAAAVTDFVPSGPAREDGGPATGRGADRGRAPRPRTRVKSALAETGVYAEATADAAVDGRSDVLAGVIPAGEAAPKPDAAPDTPPPDSPSSAYAALAKVDDVPWQPAALEWFVPTGCADEPRVNGTMHAEDGAPVRFAVLRGPFLRCRGGYGEYAGSGRALDGRFSYAILRLQDGAADRLFDVRAPGFVPARVAVTDETTEALRGGGRLDGLEVVLRRAATVVGRVLRPDGRPAPHAEVGVARRASDRSPAPDMHRRTDAQGRFRLDEIDAPAAADAAGDAAVDDIGWIVASWTDRTEGTEWLAHAIPLAGRVAAGRETQIDVVLEEVTQVALTIEFRGWRDGLEIAGDDGLSWFDCPRERTATEPSGRHRFRLRASEGSGWRHEFEFTIPSGADTHRVTVVVPPAEGTLPAPPR